MSLCHNFGGGGEGDTPALFSNPPSPGSSFPSLPSPPTSVLSIFVSLSTHSWGGGASPALLQAPPQGGGKEFREGVGLYGFIYNILKK